MMTWEELKQESKKMGGTVLEDYSGEEFICMLKFFYRKSGAIDNGVVYGNISTGRSFDQMFAIMKALQ